jgi:hypothetical protein
MNNNDLFADLFAYRFMLLDSLGYIGENDEIGNINENEIIKKLKRKLIELEYNINELNDIIFSFYNHYQINISFDEIRNIDINNLNYIDDIINIINNYTNERQRMIIVDIGRIIRNDMNEEEEDDDNSKLTENEINQIPVTKIEEELEDNCSICLEYIEINSDVYNIQCNHKFHTNCLKRHLMNYNRLCPLCRNECFSNNN